jgi:RHS repeat-associated protein
VPKFFGQLKWSYLAGTQVARGDSRGTVYYFFADPLGTARVMTNQTGVTQQESTYYPFGGEQTHGNTCNQSYHFAGMYRDSETGNDSTQFRMYESNLGRWLAPDPMAGDILNPQSLNRYAYVLNNPVNSTDPLGLFLWPEDPWGGGGGGGGWGGGWGGYYIDGMPASRSQFDALMGMGAAVLWPYSSTSGVRVTADNQVQGWVPPSQLTTTLTDENGKVIGTYAGAVQPGYWATVGSVGDAFNSMLRVTGNFFSGAGDVLSLGTTYLARKYVFDSDSVVDKGSGAYISGAATGIAIGAAIGNEMGPHGQIFGTRFGGNQPLFNANDTLRIGWSYIRSSGEYVFRIGGTAVGWIKTNPHINLWPPSWWGK